jgi:hypothetical protein
MCDEDAQAGRVPLHEFANRAVIKRLRAKSQVVSFAQYTDRDTHYPSIKKRGRVTLVGELSGEVGDGQCVSIGRWFYAQGSSLTSFVKSIHPRWYGSPRLRHPIAVLVTAQRSDTDAIRQSDRNRMCGLNFDFVGRVHSIAFGFIDRIVRVAGLWMRDEDAHAGCVPLHEFANRAVIKRLRTKSQIVSFAQYTDRDTHYPSIKNQGRVTLVGERSDEVG